MSRRVSDVEDLRRENEALRQRNEQLVHRAADAQRALEAFARREVDSVTVEASATPLLVHEAQERLRDSKDLLRAIFDGSLDAKMFEDDGGRYVDANPAASELFGLAREQLLGRSLAEFAEPGYQDGDIYQAFREQGRTRRRFLMRRFDGARRVLDYSALANVAPGLHLSVLRDVTSQVEVEDEIRRSRASLEEAQAIAHVGSWSWGLLPEGVVQFSREGALIVGVPVGVPLAVAAFMDSVHPDDRVRFSHAIRVAIDQQAPVDIEHRVVRPDGAIRWVRDRGIVERDAHGQPIRLVGTIQDVTDRQLAVEALRTSEAEFRLLTEAMPQMVWATRADGWTIYFNQHWVNYTGLTLEQSYGHGWSTPFHPDDRERALEAWQTATATGGDYSLECRLRRADGDYLWWLIRGVPFRDASGAIVKWLGTCTDIDEMKQGAERKLREERSRFEFRALVDNLPELAWMAQPDGFIDFYNRRWYAYTGTTHADMEGWGWQSVHDPDELPRVMAAWTKSIATQLPFDQTFPLRGKDGVFRWFLTRVAPIFDDSGALIRWVGLNVDVEDQRRDQQALLEAEERFRLVFEGASVGMLIVNAGGRIDLVNARIEALFGYAREELVGERIEMLLPMRFREHHPQYRQGFFANPRSRTMGDGRDLFGLRKDGSEVAIEIGLSAIRTRDGTFALGSVVDISERKRAEIAQQQIVAVVESAADAIITRDLEGVIRSWNPGATRLLGYDADEMVGQAARRLIPDDRIEEEAQVREQIATGKQLPAFETVRRKKDGTLVEVSITMSPIRDRMGSVVGASIIQRDITDRNRAERERRQLVQQLQELNVDLEERVRVRTTELSKTLRERESLLREKTSLLQEIHHRVKNNLQMISSLLNLQARQIKDTGTRALFRESQGRVRSIALLHESLYQSDDVGRVDMQGYVDKLVATLTRTYRQTARVVTEIDLVHLPADLAVPCGLIVNELVTNALKHAFPHAREGGYDEIRIEMRRVEDDLELAVSDNGSGFSGAVDPTRAETMGLTLVRDLSSQLCGIADFVTANGTRCSVRFPAPREGSRS